VPLVLEQPRTPQARALLEQDADVVAWWGTPVECASAVARLRREGGLAVSDEAAALLVLDDLRRGWFEVLPGDAVRARALRVLRIHSLRASDSLQLAAALEWSGSPAGGTVVTFDQRLADAARLEGFEVLGVRP
jgi:predicted nucleic acid-binding protein